MVMPVWCWKAARTGGSRGWRSAAAATWSVFVCAKTAGAARKNARASKIPGATKARPLLAACATRPKTCPDPGPGVCRESVLCSPISANTGQKWGTRQQRGLLRSGWRSIRSDTEHHDLSGFDQGGDRLAFFQAQLAGGVGGDDGGDDLAADGEADLGEQAFDFEVDNAADELIAAADGAHHLALRSFGASGFVEEGVEFRFGNAIVAARRFDGLQLAAIDPLLDGRIRDAKAHCGFARGEKRGHGNDFIRKQVREYADLDDMLPVMPAEEPNGFWRLRGRERTGAGKDRGSERIGVLGWVLSIGSGEGNSLKVPQQKRLLLLWGEPGRQLWGRGGGRERVGEAGPLPNDCSERLLGTTASERPPRKGALERHLWKTLVPGCGFRGDVISGLVSWSWRRE